MSARRIAVQSSRSRSLTGSLLQLRSPEVEHVILPTTRSHHRDEFPALGSGFNERRVFRAVVIEPRSVHQADGAPRLGIGGRPGHVLPPLRSGSDLSVVSRIGFVATLGVESIEIPPDAGRVLLAHRLLLRLP